MNYNTYLIFDLETGSANPHKCQPTQIAAIALHSRKLTIEPNGIFNIEIRPILDDEKAIAAGLDPVEDKALEITRKTREQLANATPPKIAWDSFVQFVNRFNYKKSDFTAPIPCGYNINGFDLPIIHRLCKEYGQVDKEGRPNLFHKIFKVDLMDLVFTWTEDNDKIKSRSLTAISEYLGIPKENIDNAHDALQDVKNTANIFIKFMKYHRTLATKTKFEKAFAGQELYIK